MNGFERMIY